MESRSISAKLNVSVSNRFLDSEVALDQAIEALMEVATAPDLYSEVRTHAHGWDVRVSGVGVCECTGVRVVV